MEETTHFQLNTLSHSPSLSVLHFASRSLRYDSVPLFCTIESLIEVSILYLSRSRFKRFPWQARSFG